MQPQLCHAHFPSFSPETGVSVSEAVSQHTSIPYTHAAAYPSSRLYRSSTALAIKVNYIGALYYQLFFSSFRGISPGETITPKHLSIPFLYIFARMKKGRMDAVIS